MMKNINYFKFLERFPEFIDIDNTVNEVKLVLLSKLKKKYWTKYTLEFEPILFPTNINDLDLLRERGFLYNNYTITFKGKKLAILTIAKNKIHYRELYGKTFYMTKEESSNIKREFILKNMLQE